MRWAPLSLVLLCSLSAAAPPSAPQEENRRAHVHHIHQDPAAYIAAMESPERDRWQRPEVLLTALGVRAGQHVADVGAGPGYFTRRLARRVGDGWVFAVDVDPHMLQALHERLRQDGVDNVTTILSSPDDPLLPDRSVDWVLLVDVYHHLGDRPAYLRRLARALRPGGRIAVVDFHKRPLPVGPPVDMKVTPEQVVADAARAGLRLLPGPPADLLPYQYVLLFAPAR